MLGELLLQTDTGTIVLTDLMPVASEQDKQTLLLPQHELLRRGFERFSNRKDEQKND